MFFNSFKLLGFNNTTRAKLRRKQKRMPGSLRIEGLEIRQMLSITTATAATIAPHETIAFTGTVATFTSPDTGPFTASIDWGDGTASGGTVNFSGGSGTVTGTHTYSEDGPYPLSIDIVDTSDSTTATPTGTANVKETNSGSAAGATISATEGVPVTGFTAAYFSDPDSPDVPSDFNATIDWGDGTTTSGTITGSDGFYTVTGDHTYTDELSGGGYSVNVSEPSANFIFPDAGNTVNVADADTLAAVGNVAISATEGATFSGSALATFTTTYTGSPASDFTANIDWGDTTMTTGTVTGTGNGTLTVSGSHLYLDELAAAPVSIVLLDNAPGTAAATATGTANVGEGDTLAPSSLTITPTEQQSFSGTVAVFTDTNSSNPAADFTASINWGDGTIDTGAAVTISGGNGANLTVSGTHTYAEDGAYTLTTTITDDTPGTASSTGTASANVKEKAFDVTSGAAITATEGTPVTGFQVATFSDPGSPDAASDFHAMIDWGDGTTTSGSISGSGGNFTVTGDHTYADELSGIFYRVSVSEPDANVTGVVANPVTVAEADTLTPVGSVAISATEGATFSGAVATFTTSYTGNVASDFTASIDWGDGTVSPGTVSGGAGTLAVSGTHFYGADELSVPVKVVFTDNAPGTASATATGTATLNEGDTLAPASTPITITPTEQQSFSGTVAVFTDTYATNSAADFTATVDWGDGTVTAGTVSGGGGANLTVGGTHTYAEDGAYTLTTTIRDDSPGTASATATASATVKEAGLILAGGGAISATEGTPVTGFKVATFQDPGSPDAASDFAATIAWGDGTTTSGTVSGSGGMFTVTGSHTYADELSGTSYLVTVSEPAANYTIGPDGAHVTVAEADTLAVVGSVAISATEGATFSGAVATFTTSYTGNVASDFTASIDWGDGTITAGSISGSGGTLTVSGSHFYGADELPAMTANVVLSDNAPGTASATATGTASVAEADVLAPVLAPVHFLATEGTTFNSAVATFTDTGYPSNSPSDFTATIDWGDGVTTAGVVSGTAGTLTVSGSHLYADEGSNLISVVLADDAPGTAKATATNTVFVQEADVLAAASTVAISATEAATFSGTVATFSTTYLANVPSDFTAVINWGDGTTSAGTVSGSVGTLTVSGSHLYADELAAAPASVTLIDDSPGTATATATGTVNVAEADTLAAVGTATLSLVERATFTGTVATFSDTGYPTNTPSDFTATIAWGDGTTTAGTVAGSAGTLTVSGTHLYAEEGFFPFKVTLTDNVPGTASATATGTATVALPPGVGFLAGVPGDDTPQTFVQNLYRELLGREPDADGFAAWVSYLQGHNNAAGRAIVIQDFLDSMEYKFHYVTTVYQLFLERAPEAAGLQFWTQKMGDPGMPGENAGSADEKYVVAAILGSDEYYYRAGNTPQAWINALYEDLFDRPADGDELAFWTNALNVRGAGDRDGIVRDMLTSPEAAHDLLDSFYGFYGAPGGTTSTPLAKPGTIAGAGLNDLALLTGAGWENLYLEGPYDSTPEGNDGFFASLVAGGNWDDIQLLMLETDQFYSNPNRPITK